jgi:mRNA interferase MazF
MSLPSGFPRRGEIWLAELDPTRGHEQAGTRPALVISSDGFNSRPNRMCVVVPVTSRRRGHPLHVAIAPPEGGLVVPCYIKCEDLRSVSQERLIRRMGSVRPETLRQTETRLRSILELWESAPRATTAERPKA